MSERIAIVGAGPAGCALACFLVERGIECIVFDDEKKPSLLVGESLIPAAIPIIKRLGIESEVAAISTLKLGAAQRHGSGSPRVDFAFQKIGKGIPEYAYNIPRPQFDKIVRQRAETLGARFIQHKASVVAVEDGERELQLSDESLAAASDKSDVEDVADIFGVKIGCEILKIIPGRVSTEVDARLSFDKEATIAKARKLIDLYSQHGIDKDVTTQI